MKRIILLACIVLNGVIASAQAPNITSEPVDASVCAGIDTSFVVAATGTALSYQWQVNMGGFFLNLSDDGFHSGANNDTLTISAADFILDGLQYRCIVSGSVAPNDTSATVTLSVSNPPSITSQPNFAVICDGGNAAFSISATGATAYQWQESADGMVWANLANGGVYSNVTTTTLDLTAAGAALNGFYYRCIASNTCGADTGAAAQLFVDQAVASTVSIAAIPDDTVCGSTATILASLGNPAAQNAFLWQVNGAFVSQFDSVFTGTGMQSGDTVQCVVIVTNACIGTDTIYSNKVGLTFYEDVNLLASNTDALVCEAASASFGVDVTGTGLLFQWLIDTNGVWMPLSDGGIYSGTASDSLTISSTTLAMDSARFALEISGQCGTDTTAASYLFIEENTTPSINISVSPGGTLCETPPIQDVTWTDVVNMTVNGDVISKTSGGNNSWNAAAASVQSISEGGYFEFENGQNNRDHYFAVSTTNTGNSFDGQYGIFFATGGAVQIWEFVTFIGNFGTYNANDVYRIGVENGDVVYYKNGVKFYTSLTPPTLPLIADITIEDEGGSFTDLKVQPYVSEITFTATANDVPAGASYQWYLNGLAVGTNDTTYTTTSLQNGDSVTCELVYNSVCLGNGSTPSNSIIANMDPATLVLVQPEDAAGCEGGSTEIGVQAQGSGLSYQWQIDTNGTWVDLTPNAVYANIASDTLQLNNLTLGMTGDRFRCVVQGACDTITSEGAELFVNPNNPGLDIVVTPPYATCSEPQLAPVSWTNGVQVNIAGNTLTKTTNQNGFNSGASSVEKVYPGAELAYEINDVMTGAVGMSDTDPDADLFSIDYAWYFTNTNRVFIYDHGTNMGLVTTTYVVGDELKLVVGDDSVYYYYNGNLEYTTPLIDPVPMVVDATIWSGLRTLTGVQMGNLPLFTANLSGVPSDYTLAWYANDALVADSTEVLSTGLVNTDDTVTAKLIIPGSCSGQDTITSNPIVFQRLDNPAVDAHPADTSVCLNNPVSFGIAASGAGITYQWQMDTSGAWQDLSNSLLFSDVNAATLNIALVAAQLDGAQFRCVVTGTCGQAISEAATLGVEAPLPIGIDVQVSPGLQACADLVSPLPLQWTNFSGTSANGSQLTKTGGTNNFDGGASSQNFVFEGGYVEYYLGNNTDYRVVGLSHTDLGNDLASIEYALYLTGTGRIFLYLSGVNMGQIGTYSGGDAFRIGYDNGTVTGYQNGSTLFTENGVTGDSLVADVSIVTIGSQIDSAVIGSPPAFTATVLNNPLSYEVSWYINSTEAASGTSVFSTFGLTDGDTVRAKLVYDQLCTGTDSLWSDPQVIEIITETQVTADPVDAGVCAGSDTSFVVAATGDAVSYQWQLDTAGAWVDVANSATFAGATDSVLMLTAPADTLSGALFRCVVMGTCGTDTSAVVELTVESAAPISLNVQVSPSLVACPELVAPQPIIWTNEDNTTANGTQLTKTGGINDFDGGASSANYVLEGGYIEYFIGNNTDYRVVGLSHIDTSNNLSSIEYALYLTGTGKVFLYTAGTNQGQVSTYVGGDSFRFDYVAGEVSMYQNDMQLFNQPGVVGDSLVADVSIVTVGSSIDSAVVGSPPVFTASLTNPPADFEYTWTVNSQPVVSGTDVFATFNLNNNDTVRCQVVYSSLCSGTDSILSAAFVMDIQESTQITSHPASATICGGTDTVFQVVATGALLAYQWQKDSSGVWVDVANDATFSGATTDLLSLTAVPDTLDGTLLRCVVFGACGDSISNTALLQVDVSTLPALSISSDRPIPYCVPAPVGDTVTWTDVANATANGPTVTKTSSSPSFNAAAISNQVIYDGGRLQFVAGTTTDVRAIGLSGSNTGNGLLDIEFAIYLAGTSEIFIYESGTSYGNFGNYTASDVFSIELNGGAVSFYQNGVLLHNAVAAPSAIPMVAHVSMWSPGMSISDLEVYNPAVFTASATNLPASHSFHWLLNGQPAIDSTTAFAPAAPAEGDTVQAFMIFQNECFGTDTVYSNKLEIDFKDNTAVLGQPQDALVCENSDTLFAITGQGAGLLYQWQIDTAGVWEDLANGAVFSGVTTDSMLVTAAPATLNGAKVRCVLVGDCSTEMSDAATLLVDENVVPTVSVSLDQALPMCEGSMLQVPVTWTNLVGVDTLGGTVTKTLASSDWNAGASTVQRVWNGGYMEVTIANTTSFRMIGLTTSDDDQSVADIERAFYAAGNGQLFVYENGVTIAGAGNYSVGDVLRIAVDGNVVRYFKNGVQVYANNTGTNAPYVVDLSIFGAGQSISNVRVSNPPVFAAEVTDLPTQASYQWMYNGINVGSDVDEYSQPTLADGDSVSVVLNYSNACIGSSSVSSAALIVQQIAATEVAMQPANAVVCPGSSADFTVSVLGDSLVYQWQIDTAGLWENVVNDATFGGSDSSTLTVANIGVDLNAALFRCQVAGFCGSTVSDSALLTVDTLPPGIVLQPMDLIGCETEAAIFTVQATGVGITYSWQRDSAGVWVDLANNATYSGVMNDSLTVSGLTNDLDSTSFRCVMAGDCWAGDTSQAALLTVLAAPQITAQPADTTGCSGDGTAFSMMAEGDGLIYQWRVSTNGGLTYNPISDGVVYSGSQTDMLTVNTVTAGMNGFLFNCIISGTCGAQITTQAALLTVANSPTISAQPQNEEICEGLTGSFAVTASGGTLSYQWQESSNGVVWNNIADGPIYSGTGTATLHIDSAYASLDGRLFRCVVTGPCNETNSQSAMVTVNLLPVADFTFVENGSLVAFTSTSQNAESWVWDFDENGATSTQENTHHVYEQSGSYNVSLTASNACGTSDTSMVVEVNFVGIPTAEMEAALQAYPVPAVHTLNVVFAHQQARVQSFGLETVTGQTVRSETLRTPSNAMRWQLNVDGLATGTYFLKVYTTDGVLIRKVLID